MLNMLPCTGRLPTPPQQRGVCSEESAGPGLRNSELQRCHPWVLG